MPDHWTYIDDWRTDDGVGFELYADLTTVPVEACLIAIPREGKPVWAASIADADSSFSLGWTGELDRPGPWQNAQRAVALQRYQDHRQ